MENPEIPTYLKTGWSNIEDIMKYLTKSLARNRLYFMVNSSLLQVSSAENEKKNESKGTSRKLVQMSNQYCYTFAARAMFSLQQWIKVHGNLMPEIEKRWITKPLSPHKFRRVFRNHPLVGGAIHGLKFSPSTLPHCFNSIQGDSSVGIHKVLSMVDSVIAKV